MRSKKRRKNRVPLYVGTFLFFFCFGILSKILLDPLKGTAKTEWTSAVGTTYTDLSYGSEPAQKFDLYLPAAPQNSYGLIVYLHAGGFTSGDKSDDTEILKWLCSKGYVTAGINYTLFGTKTPNVSVYSQSKEIRSAIPRVIEEAKQLGYPIDRMAIAGGSAGGTLALLYAYRDGATAPVPLRFVCEMVGPPSFHHTDWTTYGLDRNAEAAAVLFSQMSGNHITAAMIEADNYTEAIKCISADLWINENSVPALLAYGKHDKICPFPTVQPLLNALNANGVPYDYYEFPHSGHGLQNDNKLYLAYLEKLEEYLETYLSHSTKEAL